jgi:hypothetical protein
MRQLELWLASRRANFKNATYNEEARFLCHLFELALKFRVIATPPAAGLKGLKVETPIRTTPTWEQLLIYSIGPCILSISHEEAMAIKWKRGWNRFVECGTLANF